MKDDEFDLITPSDPIESISLKVCAGELYYDGTGCPDRSVFCIRESDSLFGFVTCKAKDDAHVLFFLKYGQDDKLDEIYNEDFDGFEDGGIGETKSFSFNRKLKVGEYKLLAILGGRIYATKDFRVIGYSNDYADYLKEAGKMSVTPSEDLSALDVLWRPVIAPNTEPEFVGMVYYYKFDKYILEYSEVFKKDEDGAYHISIANSRDNTKHFLHIRVLGSKCIITTIESGNKFEAGKAPRLFLTERQKRIASSDEENFYLGEEIEGMVSLNGVKSRLRDMLKMIQFMNIRKDKQISDENPPLHSVFTGHDGTGKYTIVKLLAKELKRRGVLTTDKVHLLSKADFGNSMMPDYGSPARNAIEAVEGGILYVEDAPSIYNITKPEDNDFSFMPFELFADATSFQRSKNWMLILSGKPSEMNLILSTFPKLASNINYFFDFPDYTPAELLKMAQSYFEEKHFVLSPAASKALELKFSDDYNFRDEDFSNGDYVHSMIDREIIPSMSKRVMENLLKITDEELTTVRAEDIPTRKIIGFDEAYSNLQKLVGLTSFKEKIEEYLDLMTIAARRRKNNLSTPVPPLHMIFMGNPGTGKTTVAKLMGKLFLSMGIISKGDVVVVDRSAIVGAFIGHTEAKFKRILKMAKGNVLFIDEAYALVPSSEPDARDFGRRAIEMLVSVLGNENLDMVVILAGYTKQMKEMMANANEGLTSRFPNVFEFEDYSEKELLAIGRGVVDKNGYVLSPEAEKELFSCIKKEYAQKKSFFGNGRFITYLLTARILPSMARRLMAASTASAGASSASDDSLDLKTILPEDIKKGYSHYHQARTANVDKEAIAEALRTLDALDGLANVKREIHDFVDSTTYALSNGMLTHSKAPIRWSFVGRTGTGKSTVARILAEILYAMGFISRNVCEQVRAESFYDLPDYLIDGVLKEEVLKASGGMLFVDGDAPRVTNTLSNFTPAQLRMKLTTLAAENGLPTAVVMAESEAPLSHDKVIVFEDYTKDELLAIMNSKFSRKSLNAAPSAVEILVKHIEQVCASGALPNARTIALLADDIAGQCFLRESKDTSLADSQRGTILDVDVEFVLKKARKAGTPRTGRRKIGY